VSNVTALQKIESAEKQGSLICFDRTNGFPQAELFRLEITEIAIAKEDCYVINKKYMPKKETVLRIGEASGVTFTNGETKVIYIDDPSCGGKHPVYVGFSQGKVRMPDGSWRASNVCEYDFDPTLRAMLDYDADELTAETKTKRKLWKNEDGTVKPYGNTLATAIKEYQKAARQRANTGAMLRVIRELVGLPIALTSDQISKPLVFGRIVQNTSYILQSPEGRDMATKQALGLDIPALYGGRKMIDAQPLTHYEMSNGEPPPVNEEPPENTAAALADQAAGSEEPDFPDETVPETRQQTEFQRLTGILLEWMEGYKEALDVMSKNGKNPYKMAEGELNDPQATVESRNSMIDRLRAWLTQKGHKV